MAKQIQINFPKKENKINNRHLAGGVMSNLFTTWYNLLKTKDIALIRAHFTVANANTRDTYARTPLHAACGEGTPDNADVVAHLLVCGVDIQHMNWFGNTALHYAAERGKLNSLRVLLSRGAHVDPKGRLWRVHSNGDILSAQHCCWTGGRS